MKINLLNRLASLDSMAKIPQQEMQWIVENGNFEIIEVGLLGPKGMTIDFLMIILSGHLSIHVDRGAGPKLVTEWKKGQVIGKVPYSRMVTSPGDTFINEKSEILKVHKDLFPEMIVQCPVFTAYTVHIMLDRVRVFNTSDLQDEKMVSLGKLAAGLAHELNNPASATVRDAKMLKTELINLDLVAREMGATNLSREQYNAIDGLRLACINRTGIKLSPIQKADHQDKINNWLEQNNLDTDLAAALADTTVHIDQLNQLSDSIPKGKFNIVLKWIVASCTTNALANDMEASSSQIYKLVDAFKKFTYMDNLSEKKTIDILAGIQDTLSVLESKVKSKNVTVDINTESDTPGIYANGSELNQVWLSLIDNALDAVDGNGKIDINIRSEVNRINIRITDNGPGIAPDNISKIFDPFFTTKAPGQGTGLGLDLAKRLLRRHNGQITVQSRPGHTQFCVSLVTGNNQGN